VSIVSVGGQSDQDAMQSLLEKTMNGESNFAPFFTPQVGGAPVYLKLGDVPVQVHGRRCAAVLGFAGT